jgi:peptidoglycan DL-endopeptidase LytE
LKKNIATLSAAALLSTTLVTPAFANTYTVKSGDNLSKIAKTHSTTVSKLIEINKLKSEKIYLNQKLNIPASNTYKKETVSIHSENTKTYTVVSGDSLIKIANKNHITLAELSSWNKLQGHIIYPGQKLIVSKSTSSSTIVLPVQKPANNPKPAVQTPSVAGSYTVKKGDSLWKIANQAGITIQSLKTVNNLKSDSISVGQTLQIPKKASEGKTPVISPIQDSTIESGGNKASIAISEAKKNIGVPYSWAGASPETGFDCSGLIYYSFKKAGYQISRLSSSTYYDLGKKVTAPQPGDLVFFNTSIPFKKIVNHMGIYLGNGEFIQASSSKGVRISSVNESYWKPRVIGYNRLQ